MGYEIYNTPLSEKTCSVTRKLLFVSDAQPFNSQGDGQVSSDSVADCLLSCATRPVARHPNRRPLAHQEGLARQRHFEGRQIGSADGPGGRRRREPPELVQDFPEEDRVQSRRRWHRQGSDRRARETKIRPSFPGPEIAGRP